jgi:tetratricopeptide (TPR) repeat protein
VAVTLAGGGWAKAGSEVRHGNKQAATGDWPEAARHWERALEHDPACHAAMHNLALAREAADDYQQARQLLERAIDIEPKKLYLGTMHAFDGREQQHQRALAQRQRRSMPPDDERLEPMLGVALLPDGPGECRR